MAGDLARELPIYFMIIIFFTISDEERRELGELIVAVAGGDEGALAAVYSRVGGRLLSVAMGFTRDLYAAQDVLHDSFIKVARYAHQFRRGTNGYAWLCKIVRNTAINKIKSENLRRGIDIDSFFSLSDGQDMAEKTRHRGGSRGRLKGASPQGEDGNLAQVLQRYDG